jgi:nitroreductase
MNAIKIRRSIRSFSEQTVEDEKIELMLRAAMQAPSAKNGQPWRFLVIKDKNKLLQMGEGLAKARRLSEANVGIAVMYDTDNLVSPHNVAADCAAATENLMIEAANLGVGTCWVGIHPLEELMDKTAELIAAPANLKVFSLIAVGYPKDIDALKFIDRYDQSKVYYESF